MGVAGALWLLLPSGTAASVVCFDAAATVPLLRCLMLPAIKILPVSPLALIRET